MAKNILLLFVTLIPAITFAQKDAMLHTSKSDYPVQYSAMTKENIKANVDKVFNYISSVTPAQMIDKQSGNAVNDVEKANGNTQLEHGDFSITSYEWGVTYSALLSASKIFNEKKYSDYVHDRFSFIAKWAPVIKKLKDEGAYSKNYPLRQPIDPHALHDAGAMCAAMIKATRAGLNSDLKSQIQTYIDWVSKKQYRFSDGTLARNRPQKNTLWLDDLYMGVPALAQMGKMTGDSKYFDDAILQVKSYSKRMFNKEKNIYMHGWVQSMPTHPEFHWARANGWALLAMSELLDVYLKIIREDRMC